jgi:hypothetical protein
VGARLWFVDILGRVTGSTRSAIRFVTGRGPGLQWGLDHLERCPEHWGACGGSP